MVGVSTHGLPMSGTSPTYQLQKVGSQVLDGCTNYPFKKEGKIGVGGVHKMQMQFLRQNQAIFKRVDIYF